jgi:hypothetical protein
MRLNQIERTQPLSTKKTTTAASLPGGGMFRPSWLTAHEIQRSEVDIYRCMSDPIVLSLTAAPTDEP